MQQWRIVFKLAQRFSILELLPHTARSSHLHDTWTYASERSRVCAHLRF